MPSKWYVLIFLSQWSIPLKGSSVIWRPAEREAGDKHGKTKNLRMLVDNVPGELISFNTETKKWPQMILASLLAIPIQISDQSFVSRL